MGFLLEERLLGSLWFLLGKKGSKLTASAGVRELGRRLGGTAAVLHVQIFHEQNLKRQTEHKAERHEAEIMTGD